MWSTRLHPECEKELLELKGKNNKLLSKVINDVKLLREFGLELLEEQRVKKLERGLFELRTKHGSDINRILFGVRGGKIFVLATSFVKKTTRTPKGMIETAKKRLAEWEE
jgi:phage-related protein